MAVLTWLNPINKRPRVSKDRADVPAHQTAAAQAKEGQAVIKESSPMNLQSYSWTLLSAKRTVTIQSRMEAASESNGA
jgi:hypothetical protein